MIQPSSIQPSSELREFLSGKVVVGNPDGTTSAVEVYDDWERPTNALPADFLVIYINGEPEGVGMRADFARGNLIVSLYSKMNDDGSIKANRIKRILEQFDTLVEKKQTAHYYFEYEASRFITPTTPNQSSGYSVTSLNLRWHTTEDFNNS